MRKLFVILLLIMSVGGWMACNNKGASQDQAAENQESKISPEELNKSLTELNDLKAKFDAAETKKDKDDLMNELSGKVQLLLSKAPNNPEANALMDNVQMYYAMAWAKQGKYKKAIEIVDNVLQFSPNNDEAKKMKAQFENWEFMTKDEFNLIKRHMYMDEVTKLVGYPLRKETKKDKFKRTVHGWFYKEPSMKKAVAIWFDENGQVWATKWPKGTKDVKATGAGN
jgi:tetratricopeptide (TPR) repeat protein